ncbi:MAG TPA: peroxiredoxin-like family protein [Ktedonobacterales bacterium]|nr:peroxiredoxin-like family protein [Ktedonobacterales bacterium]
MRLLIGQMAPDFEVRDLSGRPVALAAYRGAYVLLSFYRFAVCPVCNVRMWQLAQQAPAYQRRGLYFIACVESSEANTHFYLDRVNYPFPLIPALGSGLYRAYGLETSVLGVAKGMLTRQNVYREAARLQLGGWNIRRFDGAFGRLPADFLIGPDGRVLLAYYGRDHGDFLQPAELDLVLQSRQPAPSWPQSPQALQPPQAPGSAQAEWPPYHAPADGSEGAIWPPNP